MKIVTYQIEIFGTLYWYSIQLHILYYKWGIFHSPINVLLKHDYMSIWIKWYFIKSYLSILKKRQSAPNVYWTILVLNVPTFSYYYDKSTFQ